MMSLLLLVAIVMMLQYHGDYENEGGEDEEETRRALLSPHKSYYASFTHDNSLSVSRISTLDESRPKSNTRVTRREQESHLVDIPEEEPVVLSPQERRESLQFHRMLQTHYQIDDKDHMDIPLDMMADSDASSTTTDENSKKQVDKQVASPNNIPTYSSLIADSAPLPSYNLPSALRQISTYRTSFALLIYDPTDDEFYVLYSRKHIWSSAVSKLLRAMHTLTYLLRMEFGDVLDGMRRKGRELVLPVSSGDYPLVSDTECVRENLSKDESCLSEDEGGLAPVLHFGSVFRRPVFPNMIAMP
jgi:hypothetical protein